MKKLAFIGTNEGNGHIFSWSAIVNGRYDKERMKNCGYPVIPEYLAEEPPENLGIKGAQVSYVWTEDRNYPYPYEETVEISKVIIAGMKSRDEKRRVDLIEIEPRF